MLRAVGNQVGKVDSNAFLIFKNDDFFQKKYLHKTKSTCLVTRFSPEITKKNNMKKNPAMLQVGS